MIGQIIPAPGAGHSLISTSITDAAEIGTQAAIAGGCDQTAERTLGRVDALAGCRAIHARPNAVLATLSIALLVADELAVDLAGRIELRRDADRRSWFGGRGRFVRLGPIAREDEREE